MIVPKKKKRSHYVTKWSPAVLSLVAIGCGGSGTNPVAPIKTTDLGPVKVSYTGTPKPLLTGSNGNISTLGIAGASISNVTLNPTQNLGTTLIAFTRSLGNEGDQTYTFPGSGIGNPTLLVKTGISGYPSISQNGTICYLTYVNAGYAIQTILADGSQQKTIIGNTTGVPTISPNGSLIAYTTTTGNIFTIPIGGGTPKQIFSQGTATSSVVFNPSGTLIAFSAKTASTSNSDVYTMPITGGATTNVTPTALMPANTIVTSWSPDGSTLACYSVPKNANNSQIVTIPLNGGLSNTLTPPGFDEICPSYSPDFSKVAFYRSSFGGATPGIYIADSVGVNPQLVVPDPSDSGETGGVQTIFWSPFLQSQRFVGSGGTLSSTNVAGILLSQSNSGFASLIGFSATTPSKATIVTSASNSAGGPLLYTLSADAVTNVSFTNSFNGSHTSIPLTTTPSVVIAINSSTGLVDLVAPALRSAVQSHAAGTRITYSGDFPAVYDGSGKNIAPNGAQVLEMDQATGKLVSVR